MPNGRLMFKCPATKAGRVINVYEACIKGNCPCIHLIGGQVASLKPCRFASRLFKFEGYMLSDDASVLFNAVTDGFDIIEGDIEGYDCPNYDSILSSDCKEKMDKLIREELENGMIEIVDFKPKCIHALGPVYKPDGSIRPITDCSLPQFTSVNNHMTGLVKEFSYKGLDDVVSILKEGDFMTIIDVKSAYRLVPINPLHYTYQGFRWTLDGVEQTFVDHRLCFGLRCGPWSFTLISNFIHDMLEYEYGVSTVNYLDDNIAFGSDVTECLAAQSAVIKVIRFLGLHVSWQKVSPPSRVAVYLGIQIDSIKLELSLPKNKIDRILVQLEEICESNRITR